MNTDAQSTPSETQAGVTSKSGKAKAHRQRSATKGGKLVCRYCGSDDLAPSFRKRRDARCRACFKKRYGTAGRKKKTTRRREKKSAK